MEIHTELFQHVYNDLCEAPFNEVLQNTSEWSLARHTKIFLGKHPYMELHKAP